MKSIPNGEEIRIRRQWVWHSELCQQLLSLIELVHLDSDDADKENISSEFAPVSLTLPTKPHKKPHATSSNLESK